MRIFIASNSKKRFIFIIFKIKYFWYEFYIHGIEWTSNIDQNKYILRKNQKPKSFILNSSWKLPVWKIGRKAYSLSTYNIYLFSQMRYSLIILSLFDNSENIMVFKIRRSNVKLNLIQNKVKEKIYYFQK